MLHNASWAWISSLICTLLFSTVAVANQSDNQLPREITINGVEFVLIPEGWTYRTGGIALPGIKQTHLDESGGGNVKVWLDSYYIAKYEARARHFVPFLNRVRGTGLEYNEANESCSVRRDTAGNYVLFRPTEDLPATHLSWKLADAWATDMGFRLPTEAEWEKAARGESTQLWPWGNDWPDETYLGFRTKRDCYTWPVDAFAKGQSPYGVFNMSGNIREFVSDWYDKEADTQLQEGSKNPVTKNKTLGEDPLSEWDAGPWKILKGGRWASGPDAVKVSARVYYTTNRSFRCNGTRFALDTETVRKYLAENKVTVTRL